MQIITYIYVYIADNIRAHYYKMFYALSVKKILFLPSVPPTQLTSQQDHERQRARHVCAIMTPADHMTSLRVERVASCQKSKQREFVDKYVIILR